MEEYFSAVAQRYGTLDQQQKTQLRNFIDTDMGNLVTFVLGPEMETLVNAMKEETQQMVEPDFLRG